MREQPKQHRVDDHQRLATRCLTSAVDGISVITASSLVGGKDIFVPEANFSKGDGVGFRASKRLCFSTSSMMDTFASADEIEEVVGSLFVADVVTVVARDEESAVEELS